MAKSRQSNGRFGEEVVAFRELPHITRVVDEQRALTQKAVGVMLARGSITVSLGLRTIESLGKLMIAFGENRGRVIDRAVAELAERELKEG